MWLYRIGNTRLTGLVETLKYTSADSGAGNVREYKRNAWYAVIEQFFGGNTNSVFFSYGQAQSGSCARNGPLACITTDLGAKYMTLGWIHRFSKRTEMVVAYYKMDNERNAQYSPGPAVNGVNVAPGADTQAFGIGLWHYF